MSKRKSHNGMLLSNKSDLPLKWHTNFIKVHCEKAIKETDDTLTAYQWGETLKWINGLEENRLKSREYYNKYNARQRAKQGSKK